MKPIYCAESYDRIPIEFFSQGKAIWSGGKPYLKEHADRLRLKPDASPPPEYHGALSRALIRENQQKAAKPAAPGKGPGGKDLAATQRGQVVPIKTTIQSEQGTTKGTADRSTLRPASGEHIKPLPIEKPKQGIDMSLPSYSMEEQAQMAAALMNPDIPFPKPSPLSVETLPALSPEESAKLAAARISVRTIPKSAPATPPKPPAPPVESPKPPVPEPVAAKPTPPAVAEKPPAPPVVVESPKPPVPEPVAAKPAPPTVAEKPPAPPVVVESPKPPVPEPVAAKPATPAVAEKPPAPPVVVESPKPPVPEPVAAKPAPPTIADKPPAPPVVVNSPKLSVPEPVAAKPAPVAEKPAAVGAPPKPPLNPALSGVKPPAAKAPGAPPKPAAAGRSEEELEIQIPLQPGDPLSLEEMKQLEFLDGISDAVLRRLYGGIVRRTFKRGELICRQGDSASTAFYILSGTADAYILTPESTAQMKSKEKKTTEKIEANGLLERLKFWVQGRKQGSKKSRSGRRPIPSDGPVDLPPDTRMNELKAGDLFGEMSCINFYPRASTVRARTECVMVEMIRTVIDAVKEKGKYKEKLDKTYRERSLEQHLNSIPIFMDLGPEFIDELRKRVELQDFKPGQPIFKQGDEPDAFYLVRRGCIKVSQKQPGGEMVLSYLGPNDYFGEIGMLRNAKRGATCTALDHVEVVKIERKYFKFIIECFDEFKTRLEKETEARLAMGRNMTQHAPTHALGEFLDQELVQAQNMLLIDLERCTRCDECVKACVDIHDDGITRLVREGLRFDKYLVATSCRSCMDPVCMIGCPVGSIRREASFEIIIEDWCIGCGKCAKQCPYGNISMHDFALTAEQLAKETAKEADTLLKKSAEAAAKAGPAKENAKVGAEAKPAAKLDLKQAQVNTLAVTCDQCSTLQEPSCVYACPHEAAIRVNAREFFDMSGKMALKEKGKSVKT